MHGVDAIIEMGDDVDGVMTGVTVMDGVDGIIVVTSLFFYLFIYLFISSFSLFSPFPFISSLFFLASL